MRTDSESLACQPLGSGPRPIAAPRVRPAHSAAAWFAGATAALGWIALLIEMNRSVSVSLAEGHHLAEALFLFFRFFTILTNIGIAALMSVTAVRLFTGRSMLSARVYNAGVIYILVVCVTYEIILRTSWAPSSMQFFTDFALHDIIPVLTLAFWTTYAPHLGCRWNDAWLILIYPALYFAVTLVAGALGEGYPYNFFNVDVLGYPRVIAIAGLFLTAFLALSLTTTALAKLRALRSRMS